MKTPLRSFVWIIGLMMMLALPALAQPEPGKFVDPNTLLEIQLDPSWKNLIVVIHGWNPPDILTGVTPANKFTDGYWPQLLSDLDDATQNSDWHVVAYNWTQQGASTGAIWSNRIFIANSADEAVTNAISHGPLIASEIATRIPNLRQVHFIAHSAGIWAAKGALIQVLSQTQNKFVVAQMTLLDAYLPDVAAGTDAGMKNLIEMPDTIAAYGARIHRLEHYYADDILPGTNSPFVWRPGIDIGGQRIDYAYIFTPPLGNQQIAYEYLDHSGPIQFYSDVVAASVRDPASVRLTRPRPNNNYEYNALGWNRSLFRQSSIRPSFSVQPHTTPAVPHTGDLVTLSATAASGATTYRWFKGDSPISGATSAAYQISSASTADNGTYVLEISNQNGVLYSDPLVVNVQAAPSSPLAGLAISGPTSIDEGSNGTFTSTASFSDGTTAPAAPTWSVSSGAASISQAGILTAGAVATSTPVIVSASYTTGGITKTATANVTINHTGNSGDGGLSQGLIANGDFSQGANGWQRASAFHADNSFSDAHSSGGYAYLSNADGSPGNNLYGEMAQYISIPANATQVTLSYWYHITTEEAGAVAFDTMSLEVVPQAGDIETIDSVSNLDANGSYQQRTFDLTRFKGQQILIAFVASTDASYPTTFRIDDVSASVVLTNPPQVATYNAATDAPVTSNGYTVSPSTPVSFTLNFTPTVGTNLMVVNNTGLDFIHGTYSNLAQGQSVALSYGGITYNFVANYYGGTGNDLVLQWANTRLLAWGNNQYGEIGDGTTSINSPFAKPEPVAVDRKGVLAGRTVISLSAGEYNSLALCSDGTLAAWGFAGYGGLGNNRYTDSPVPVPVERTGALSGKMVIAVSAGYQFNLALCSDGMLTAWGSNSIGQLGNSRYTDSPVPVAVERTGVLSGKTVIAVSAGGFHSLALCSDGTLAAWGYNGRGQLGDGSNSDSTVPVAVRRTGVLLGKTVVAVSAGFHHSLALCSDGTVAAWGQPVLGNNTQNESTVPVAVNSEPGVSALAGKTVTAVAAGGLHSLALCSDGTVAAWGLNSGGELGNNSTTWGFVPVAVNRLGGSALFGKTVVAVFAGIHHSLALCSDGTLVAWGDNSRGELGDNNLTNSLVPVPVSTGSLITSEHFVTGASGLSAYHSLGIAASPGPPLPAVTTLAATSVTSTGGTLSGTVNANGTSAAVSFDYGISTSYGSSVAALPTSVNGSSASTVSATVSGLVPNTTYHYRVNGTSSVGTTNGCDLTFKTALNNNADLTSLALTGGTMSPSFASGTTSYTASVANLTTSITITPGVADSNATVTVNGTTVTSGTPSGPINLNVGNNTVTTVVTAQDGTTIRTYTLIVTRAASANANLASFVLSSGILSPPFTSNTTSYNAIVSNTTSSMTVTPSVADSNAVVAVNGSPVTSGSASSPISLNPGNNTITALVTAQDGTTIKSYLITIYRAEGTTPQTISFPPIPTKLAASSPFSLGASASSGLNVAYQVVAGNGVASVSGNTITLTGTPGAYTVAADQPGDATFVSAPTVLRTGAVIAGSPFVQVFGGPTAFHLLGIRADGTLWAWGTNTNGQIGDGTTASRAGPVQVGTATNWKAVAVGGSHTIAVRTDGTLWAWGRNTNGQLGDGTTSGRSSPVQIGTATNWKNLAAGVSHTAAVKTDGTLWAWGLNTNGQLGDGTTTQRNSPVQVGTENTWKSVTAGSNHTLALKTDGTLWAWGLNTYGQLGDGTATQRTSPVQIGAATNWQNITGGYYHSVATKSDGTLWAWGYNGFGGLGDGTTTLRTSPVQIGTATDWQSIAAGGYFTMALKTGGTLWAWGRNDNGQLGDGTTTQRTNPMQIGTDTNWLGIAAGVPTSLALKSDQSLWGWGASTVGYQPRLPLPVVLSLGTLSTAAGGGLHTLAIKPDGTLWSWGDNAWGQLGDGTTTRTSAPAQIGTSTNWQRVAGGLDSSTAIKTDGTLWAWGSNYYGQLGDGTTTTRKSPVQVGSDNNWSSVAMGGYLFCLAVKTDGTLWAWGANFYNQLGDGTNTDRHSPQQVGTDTNWRSAAAGDGHALAVKTDGTLWAWGRNDGGQLGDGTTTQQTRPVQVGTNTNWKSVIAGYGHTLALKTDGTLWAWGANSSGQLGDGTTTSRTSPVQVGTAADWSSISAVNNTSLGLKSGGTLWAWGSDLYGTLGDGAYSNRTSPVQVGTSTGWLSLPLLSPDGQHALALTSEGTLWGFGDNSDGQLSAAGRNPSVPGSVLPTLTEQTITFPTLPALTAGSVLTLAGSSSSGLPVSYIARGPASVSGNQLVISGTGQVSVIAYQPGDSYWQASDIVLQTSVATVPVPTVTTSAAASVTSTGATLNGTVNANNGSAAVSFDYGTSTSYGTNIAGTPTPVTGSIATAVSASLTGLTPNTTYHFRVKATTGAGTTNSNDLTFTTLLPNEDWRLQKFGNPANNGDGADVADPNHNGINNLLEYALNGDPTGGTTGTSVLPQASTNGAGHLQLAFTRYLDRNDLTLTVQANDSLTGTWTDLAQSVNGAAFSVITPGATVNETGSGNTRFVTVGDQFLMTDPAHPHRFMRLQVTH